MQGTQAEKFSARVPCIFQQSASSRDFPPTVIFVEGIRPYNIGMEEMKKEHHLQVFPQSRFLIWMHHSFFACREVLLPRDRSLPGYQ